MENIVEGCYFQPVMKKEQVGIQHQLGIWPASYSLLYTGLQYSYGQLAMNFSYS